MLPDVDIRFLFGWYLVILVVTMIAMRGPPRSPGAQDPQDVEFQPLKRSYADRLIVDINLFFVWPLILRDAIHDFFDAIDRVLSVKPFVTGLYEQHQKMGYCVGPVKNPMPTKLESQEIYVVVEEEVGILKHSFWPGLKFNADANVEDDWSGYDYNIIRDPPEFFGQLEREEVGRVHRITYDLLLVSRAVSLFLLRCAVRVLPYRLPTVRVFRREYEVFPIPTEEQVEEARKAKVYTEEIYKPLRSDLIRGPDALVAARRAGFKYDV